MNKRDFERLSELLSDPRVSQRLSALDQITVKSGRRIVRLWSDQQPITLLKGALTDPSARVRRAAARGLRGWVAEQPGLFEAVLPEYTTPSFNGRYSHLGLYDTRTGDVWIPRLAALKGHAAFLKEGNTDRYLKFEFFVPGQAPQYLRSSGDRDGHLMVQLIPEWSYSRHALIRADEERQRRENLLEQKRYSSAVVNFYREAVLPYAVRVHHVFGAREHPHPRELDVAFIPAAPKASSTLP